MLCRRFSVIFGNEFFLQIAIVTYKAKRNSLTLVLKGLMSSIEITNVKNLYYGCIFFIGGKCSIYKGIFY